MKSQHAAHASLQTACLLGNGERKEYAIRVIRRLSQLGDKSLDLFAEIAAR